MLILLFPLALVVFIKPVSGFLLFLFMNSGTQGFMYKILESFQSGLLSDTDKNIGLYLVILVLFFRNNISTSKTKRTMSLIGALLWAFTIARCISIIFEWNAFDLKDNISDLLYCLIWAPLFSTFLRLSDAQREQCRKLIIFFSALTAFLNLFIIITKNNFLNNMLNMQRLDPEVSELALDVLDRPRLPSIYALMPFGFWFCIEDFIVRGSRLKSSRLLYFIGALLMFGATLFTFTRTVLLGTSLGVVLVITLLLFSRAKSNIKKKIMLIVLVLTLSLAAVFMFLPDITEVWITRITSIKYTSEDPALASRVNLNEFMIDNLTKEVPLLGHRAEIIPFRGDPHTIFTIWWRFGLIAALIFILLIFAVFVKLFKILLPGGLYSAESRLRAIFLAGCYLQFQFTMISGTYLYQAIVFPLMFFLSEVDLLTPNRLSKETNLKPAEFK